MLQSCNIGDRGSDLPPKIDPIHKLGIGQETGYTSGKVCKTYQRSVLQLIKLSASYAKPMFFSARVNLCQNSIIVSLWENTPITSSGGFPPFHFCWQTLTSPLTINNRVFPGNLHNEMILFTYYAIFENEWMSPVSDRNVIFIH